MSKTKTKTVKVIVSHPRLFLSVKGKLQHVEKGTELTLTPEQVESLGSKVCDPAQAKKLNASGLPEAAPEPMAAIVDDLSAKLNAEAAARKAAEEELATLKAAASKKTTAKK